MITCPHCHFENPDDARFCGRCGRPLVENETRQQHFDPAGQQKKSTLLDSVNQFVGSDRPADLNWRVLFSDVFRSHPAEEAEELFICGTKTTTPQPSEVMKGWPHPWLYSRVLLMFVATYVLLWLCVNAFGNTNALPGMIVMGSFAMPLATLVLFVELNAWRNISFYQVVKVFFIGGCASLLATLFLFSFQTPGMSAQMTYWEAFTVGFIEEVGKAVIVYLFLKKMSDRANILSGMVIGASIGAGFAAFESAGYALQPLIDFCLSQGYAIAHGQQLDPQIMLTAINRSVIARGFLAPGGHVAWAALSGAGLVMAAKSCGHFSLGLLVDGKFLRLFLISFVLHGLWDSPLAGVINSIIPFAGYIALILMVWVVVLLIINMGLAEVSKASQYSNQ